MELNEQSIWLLPSVELALCLQLLGAPERKILPVRKTEEPLHRRMLNGFLHLAELGLVEPAGEKFQPTALLRRCLGPVVEAERILFFPDGGNPMAVYFFGDAQVSIEAADADGRTYRVRYPTHEELYALAEARLAAAIDAHPSVEFRDRDGTLLAWLRFSADGAEDTVLLTEQTLTRTLDGQWKPVLPEERPARAGERKRR